MDEDAAGIECYANSADGFRAILKERYADFVVNEIGLDGQVVNLTRVDASLDDEIDERETQKRQKLMPGVEPAGDMGHLAKQAAEPRQNANPEVNTISSEESSPEQLAAAEAELASRVQAALTEFTKIAGEVESARLKAFLEQPGVLTPAPEDVEAPSPLVLASSNDKGYRTSLHAFFGLHFQLPTDTVDPPGGGEGTGPMKKDSKRPNLCIRVHPKKHSRGRGSGNGGGNAGGGQKRSRDGEGKDGWSGHKRWPQDLPQYLEFTLCKENKDTGDTIGVLSRILHVKPRAFGFAGTKDRRGVTSQRVTLYKMRASRLAKLKLRGIKIGDYRYVDRELGLGDLKGNLFTLTLRGIEDGTQDKVTRAVNAMNSSGFINYFGLQRFGTHSCGHTPGWCCALAWCMV